MTDRGERPLLFLDVDGTLLPYGGAWLPSTDDDWGVWQSAANPQLARLDRAHGPRLLALPCALIWATAWMDEANAVIGPLLGLPRLPVADLPDPPDGDPAALHWKTRALVEAAAGRPFAWVDDEITPFDRTWVSAHHQGPALLHRVDPTTGLVEADYVRIGEWLGEVSSGRWSRRAHAGSFGAAAEAYQRGRPPYPASAVEWAVPREARRVLDLGAGTGKFTQLLVDAKLDVIAVEPSEPMREQLAAAVPGAAVRAGSAEAIPLGDASVDAVVVAQAWHWVDTALAVPEVARVLVPGGTLSLIWNVRDHTEPWISALDELLGQHTRQEMDTDPVVGGPFGEPERTEIRWRHRVTPDGLIDMVASRSYVIVLPEDERAQLLADVSKLLGTHPDLAGREEFAVPYVTRCTRVRRV